MKAWQRLNPHSDAVEGLNRLKSRFRLVALSNGEPDFLARLARNRIGFEFDEIISVDEAGVFKPHPSVYRTAARLLESEPSEIMMVAAHSFDIMGAVACGYSGAFVNRYGLPYEDTDQVRARASCGRLHRVWPTRFWRSRNSGWSKRCGRCGRWRRGRVGGLFRVAQGSVVYGFGQGQDRRRRVLRGIGRTVIVAWQRSVSSAWTAQPEAVSRAGPGHPRGVRRGHRARPVRRTDPRLRRRRCHWTPGSCASVHGSRREGCLGVV